MVVFDPQLNEVTPPDWGRYSRPISDIPANKSTAMAINAATETLGEAVKVTDTAIKEGIKTDVRGGVENLRDAYTESLKDLRNQQLASADKSLLPEDDTNKPPMQLQSGLDRVRQVGTAIAQNGNKINDTLYTGALNSMAKQLRNQYPGYKDYIDAQISSVSGIDPANAFYKNLMEDINRNVDANKTEHNATNSMLRDLAKSGFRDSAGVEAADVYKLYNDGRLDANQVLKWTSSAKKLEWDTAQRAAARADRKGGQEDDAVNATKDLSDITNKTTAHNWTTLTIGKGTDTPAALFKYLQANAGSENVTDERSRAIGQQLVAMRNATFQSAWEKANEGGANSIVTKLGGDPEKAKKVIEGQLATFDLAIQSVFKNDWGSAYSHMNFNKAISADTTNLLYNAPDEDVRRYNRAVGAVNEISPQAASQFFQSAIIGQVPQREKEYLKTMKLDLLTQPDQPMGKLTSIQGAINTAKAKGVTSPQSFSELVNSVSMLSDPKFGESQRVNIAKAFFDPEQNAGLLSDKNFVKDYYDTTQKRQIPGKYSVFTRLSSPETAAGIAELSKTHPELAPMYRSTMSREFGEQLFSRELRDLGGANRDVTPSSLYKIGYVDDKNHPPRFEIVGPRGEPMTSTEAIALRAPVAEVNRLNIGLSGMHTVYKGTGSKDPNTEILSTMYKYGYQSAKDVNNSPGRTESISGIPGQFWQALVSAQTDRLRAIKGRVKEPE